MKRLIVAAVVAAAGFAFADSTPVMVSLLTPVQAPSSDYDVAGLRLSLVYGQCERFKGFDIGIVNRTAGDFFGFSLGGVNVVNGRVLGGQVGLVNCNSLGGTEWRNRPIGAQIGLVNYADEFCGMQWGVINASGSLFTGHQCGLVNIAEDIAGFQGSIFFYGLICVNVATGPVRGCQLGLITYADEMDTGLQIGLVNIIARGGWFPVLPIVNGNF